MFKNHRRFDFRIRKKQKGKNMKAKELQEAIQRIEPLLAQGSGLSEAHGALLYEKRVIGVTDGKVVAVIPFAESFTHSGAINGKAFAQSWSKHPTNLAACRSNLDRCRILCLTAVPQHL